ncbi:WD40 repeat-like protein, partial [Ramicandelaber brevisporus]
MGRVMNVNALVKSYSQLNDWIDRSLDRFRPELTTVAYPLFVHTFLDIMASSDALDLCFEKAKLLLQQFGSIHEELHSADIRTLRAITAPQQAKSSGLCRLYRNNRYTVRVSIAARRLLEAFLQDTSSDEMLRLLNQYIDFAPEDDRNVAASGGVSGGPIDRTAVSAASRKYDVGITGQSGAHVIEINSAAIALGAPPKPTGLDEQLTKVAKYMPQTVRDTSETDLDPSGLLAASGIGLSKRDRSQTAAADGDGGSLPVDPLPQAPLRSTDVLTEFQRLRDLRKRVNLSSTALPSVCAFTVLNTSGAMTCASATDDLSLMACGFSESYIKLWNLKGEPLRGVQGSTGLVPININSSSDMANHRDNYSSATRRLIGHSSSVYAVKFSSDKRFLLSCSADQTARLWSLDTFTNLVCYKGHLGPVWDLDVSPVGPYFVTGSHDRTARLWSTEHTYPLRVFVGHSSDVDCVKFHPNTNYVITGSSDRTIRLWSTHNGQCVRIFTGHDDAISCLAISPDGRMLASAAEDKAIILWDLASGRQIQRMTGHTRSINSLAFDVDGRLLMSGGADNTVRLWSTTSTSTSNGSINGLKRSQDGKSVTESQNLLTTLHTKMTPVYSTQFTPRNLGYMIGAY